MKEYEEFIDYYKWPNVWRCAWEDIKKYKEYKVGGFALIAVVAFFYLIIGAFVKEGWISLLFFLSSSPFVTVWMFFVSRTPVVSSLRSDIFRYLDYIRENGCWDDLCSYLSSQYVFENTKPFWRTGYGIAMIPLAIGQGIGYLSGMDNFLNIKITTFLIVASISIFYIVFLFDNVFPCRRTLIHLSIKDIKKFHDINGNS